MKRREFIGLLSGVAAAPLGARAQQTSIPVIGVLSPESSKSREVEGLRAGLRDLGYFEGRNIRYEYRWADGKFERLSALATELVDLKADVIVTYVTQASLVAKKATTSIPIVMVGVADPVGVGLIASLAQPGGNVTGTSSMAAILATKQLELVKETLPNISRVAALWNPANPAFQTLQVNQVRDAAKTLRIDLQLFEARAAEEFDAVFTTMEKSGTRTLLILVDPLFSNNFPKLVELSAKARLFAMTGYRAFADAGGLMAYGPNYKDIYNLCAVYVDKILKGAKPAYLPVQQPTKFELVINLKRAKELGFTIPETVLARADEVIE
jgi:putative ABC transport system substrate-binding protein